MRKIKHILRGLFLTVMFHLPVWKKGYGNGKYAYLGDMPNWMQYCIHQKNKHGDNTFYWLKIGRLYIRNYYCKPCKPFMYSERHLFVWKSNKCY